jgi:hypothetical protein
MFRNIPCTAAYVKPGAVYSDEMVRDWLEDPSNIENRFAASYGKIIPQNYLDLFQKDLDFISKILHDKELYIFQLETHIFFVKIYVDKGEKWIMLKEFYVRPCAEGQSIFRIILFLLARCCIQLDLDLYLEKSSDATIAILKKSFGEGNMEIINEYIPHAGLAPKNYHIIRCRTLKTLKLEKILGFDVEEDPLKCKLVYDADKVRLNQICFPTAHILNFGPDHVFSEEHESNILVGEEYAPYDRSIRYVDGRAARLFYSDEL